MEIRDFQIVLEEGIQNAAEFRMVANKVTPKILNWAKQYACLMIEQFDSVYDAVELLSMELDEHQEEVAILAMYYYDQING